MKAFLYIFLVIAFITISFTSNAAEISLNLYGSTPLIEFLGASSPGFLQSQGCRAQDISTATDYDRKHYIAICRGTEQGGQGFNNNGNTYYLRFSLESDYDGIRAVQGLDPDGASGSCYDNERLMANEATVSAPSAAWCFL